jgi:hypothetical protein
MALLRRIPVMLLAYLAAAAVGAIVFLLGSYLVARTHPALAAMPLPNFQIVLQVIPYVFVPTLAAAFVPALIVAALAETYRIRSFAFYAAAGAAVSVIGMMSFRLMLYLTMFRPKPPARGIGLSFSVPWSLVAAGIISGLVYWAIAGRNSGKWRALSAGT